MYEEFFEEVKTLKKRHESEIGKERVIFYGSSSFRLWENAQTDLSGIELLNLAFGGSNLGACDYYFDMLFEKANPTHLVLYCGDNDCVDGIEVENVLNEFVSLYRKIRSKYPLVPFSFVSIKPSPSKSHLLNQIQEVNTGINSFLTDESNSSFLDLHYKMLNSDGSVRNELYSEDELHLNQDGYALWTSLFREYFKLDLLVN